MVAARHDLGVWDVGDVLEDLCTPEGVVLDEGVLLVVESAGLLEDGVGHADLADVVQQCGVGELLDMLRDPAQRAGQLARVLGDARRMAPGVLVLGVDGERQRMHCVERHLLDLQLSLAGERGLALHLALEVLAQVLQLLEGLQQLGVVLGLEPKEQRQDAQGGVEDGEQHVGEEEALQHHARGHQEDEAQVAQHLLERVGGAGAHDAGKAVQQEVARHEVDDDVGRAKEVGGALHREDDARPGIAHQQQRVAQQHQAVELQQRAAEGVALAASARVLHEKVAGERGRKVVAAVAEVEQDWVGVPAQHEHRADVEDLGEQGGGREGHEAAAAGPHIGEVDTQGGEDDCEDKRARNLERDVVIGHPYLPLAGVLLMR